MTQATLTTGTETWRKLDTEATRLLAFANELRTVCARLRMTRAESTAVGVDRLRQQMQADDIELAENLLDDMLEHVEQLNAERDSLRE